VKHLAWFVLVLTLFLGACVDQADIVPLETQPDTGGPSPIEPTATLVSTGAMTETVGMVAMNPEDMITYRIVPEESQVIYTVDEVFLSEGVVDSTAVGVTQLVEGEILYDPDNVQNSIIRPITVDISAFASDEEQRDQRIREEWLESARYPIATFIPTAVEGLPQTYTEGQELAVQINGQLTVREVAQPQIFATVVKIEGNRMTGTATTTIQMTDYGFDPPNIAGVLRVDNDVTITFEFVAVP
jgi:polyisoprenoid-binding protein YceI